MPSPSTGKLSVATVAKGKKRKKGQILANFIKINPESRAIDGLQIRPHSVRKAWFGSIDAARRAGTKAAMRAQEVNTRNAPPRTAGSNLPTS
jgi:hypothetical protein